MAKEYQNYSIRDFALDDSFKKWVFHPEDTQLALKWEDWLQNHPEKAKEVEKAKQIISLINFGNDSPTSVEIQQAWEKVSGSLKTFIYQKYLDSNESEADSKGHHAGGNIFLRPWFRVAATVTILLGVTLVLFNIIGSNKYITYQTEYGQTREVLLPDSSIVTLNANSLIRFHKNWEALSKNQKKEGKGQNDPREVWLKGEAYFDIQRAGNSQKFIVHSDKVDIEVLGTAFNVENRHGKTQVVLSEGKVKLTAKKALKKLESIIMNPGDLVEYRRAQITQKVVNPEVYTSWRNNKMVFDGFKLSRVAQMLEDNYGVRVKIRDEELANRKFKGTFPSDNMDILIKALAETFDIKITQEGKRLIMQNKKDS